MTSSRPSALALPVRWLTTNPQVITATTFTYPATHASEIASRACRMRVCARFTSMVGPIPAVGGILPL